VTDSPGISGSKEKKPSSQ